MKKTMAKLLGMVLVLTLCTGVIPAVIVSAAPDFTPETYYLKSDFNGYTQTVSGSQGHKHTVMGDYFDIGSAEYGTWAVERLNLASIAGASGNEGDYAVELQVGEGGMGSSGVGPYLQMTLANAITASGKYVFEADVKVSSGVTIYTQGFFASHMYLYPAPITTKDALTPAFENNWKKLVIVMDFDKSMASVYYDGIYYGSGACDSNSNIIKTGAVSILAYATGAGELSLDNVALYKPYDESALIDTYIASDFNKATSDIANFATFYNEMEVGVGQFSSYSNATSDSGDKIRYGLLSVAGASGEKGDYAIQAKTVTNDAGLLTLSFSAISDELASANRAILEMDIKLSSGMYLRLMNVAGHIYIIDNYSNFINGKYGYTPDVWKKMVIDFNYDNDTAYIYYDGEYAGFFTGIASGKVYTTPSTGLSIQISSANASGGTVSFDNVKFYKEKADRKIYLDGHFNNLNTTPAQSNDNTAVLARSFTTYESANVIDFTPTTVASRNYMLNDNGASGKTGDYAVKIAVSPKLVTSDTYELNEGNRLDFFPLEGAKTATKLTFEADTYMTGKGNVVFENMFDTFRTNLFNEDGKILGSDKEYALNAWKKLRVDFDYSADKAYIYYDGEYCSTVNGICNGGYRIKDANPLRIRLNKTTDTGFALSIDNIKMFEETGAVFAVSGHGFETESETAITSSNYYTAVSSSADAVIVNTVNALNKKSASEIKLYCEGALVPSTAEINGTAISVKPVDGFADGKVYTVVIGKNAKTGGITHRVDTLRSFVANKFDEILLSKTDNGYRLQLYTVSNTVGSYALMLAQYASEDRLASIERKKVGVAEGINIFDFTTPGNGSEIKAVGYCWGGSSLMEPVLNASTPVAE